MDRSRERIGRKSQMGYSSKADIAKRITRQSAENLRRLANQGEEAGVRILLDYKHGQHIATCPADPTACHLVDASFGCSCRVYQQFARCQHYGLLLSQLGLILDQVERTAA